MFTVVRVQRASIIGKHISSNAQIARAIAGKRGIHQTPAVLKKKKAEAAGISFDDEVDGFLGAEEDDLFGDSKTQANSTTNTSVKKTKGKLSIEERATRFDALHQFLSDRIGLHPAAKERKDPKQVRRTAWQQLFSLATTAEQLERVTELFPKWRDSRQQFTPQIAEAFVRRCEELRCPDLALKVFSDHSKYGFNLDYLPAARQLLHSLHVERPLEDSVTLSALYGVYKLPAISSDLVSCALFTSALFKAKTEESLVVASALVPELKILLDRTAPEKMVYPVDKFARSRQGNKEKIWLRWTLLKIEKALEAQRQPVDWLKTWRHASLLAAGVTEA